MRFKNWKPPVFDEDGWAYSDDPNIDACIRYGWRCQYPEKLKLGKNVDIGCFTYMNACHGIEIEDEVGLGSNCNIYSISVHWKKKQGKVLIKRNARIGSHSMIMPGVTIGKNAVVGAFSFVDKDIPDNVLAFGIPVRIKRVLTVDEIHQLEDSVVDILK